MNKETFLTLFVRDLKRLRVEIEQYPSEESLWVPLPGTINSGGNLCQHLIGNLRTYVGLTLGGVAYVRNRDAEFADKVFSKSGLLEQIDLLLEIIPQALEKLDDTAMHAEYPRGVLDMFTEQSVNLILQHLLAHFSYHLGQINYHRRWVSTVFNQ
ncbi:DUF1572 family protein [Dyadobacter pollutisoli]|jgi:hypothetical protein|uniref:DUF1572 family protein n=1 Tax=Dyadobacter pollutisoli TaxID=2910158 RepID=A0A9E8SMQ5_9BACT|nr:DUF1572 family protein [Dyadobacter pollutisoli]WAC14388.1 DUF1572 family protein [Dyadobacter pollutisoli]